MNGVSFYKEKLTDSKAVYFTQDNFNIKNDGTEDVSVQLQEAIHAVVKQDGYGVLFVPEGKYLLSGTIYVPKAVRIIGYGKNRPEFILQDNADGFNEPHPEQKGGFKYLFWFTNKMEEDESRIQDANPGTFYSAMSNVNVSLGRGNSQAVAFRTHYAQHCFINHIDINVESGMAGIYDVGNEMEDIFINGGKYGIVTTKCSPGWPFVMVDVRFNGQTAAAIRTHEAGLNIIRAHSTNTSKFIDVDEGYFEKLIIEDSIFEDMNTFLDIAQEKNQLTQINVKNCYLRAVENIVSFKDTGRKINSEDYQCRLKKYTHGIVASDINPDKQFHDEIYRYAREVDYSILKTDLPVLQEMDLWANAKYLGLKGDGVTDDTEALKNAVEKYQTIYFPQGEYILTDTITLEEDTSFVGMNPVSTRLVLKENAEKFTGFGKVKPFIKTSTGKNILFGLGVYTGGRNPRACGVFWCANGDSYMNDVKFFGGHGNLVKGTGDFEMPYDRGRARDADLKKIWDYQYPSLLIRNGGGIFKDVWSASPYVTAGVQIEKNNSPIRIYCLSLEHHQRCEIRMKKAKDVTIYGFQSEEEKAEGEFAQPIELHNCKDITFASTYCFRTVFVNKPYPYCVKTWDCENIKFLNVHNYSQMKYTIDNFLLDVNTGIEVRPWQAARIEVTGKETSHVTRNTVVEFSMDSKNKYSNELLYSGFRFADGGCCDGRGNFYFLDSLDKKIYRIDGKTLKMTMYFESPFKINSIGFDTRDNIVVVGEYSIPREATLNGKEIINNLPPDSYGTSYGFWYDSRAIVVAFTIDKNGDIEKLHKVNIGDIKPERVLYPGNRWRDGNDFEQVVTYNPKKAFLAKDGKTIIPCHYDLMRANNLSRSKPGRKLYSVDELYKRVWQCDITEDGLLENPVPIIEEGDYKVRKFNNKIYVADDNIKIYEDFKLSDTIRLPQRPTTFDFGGEKRKNLIVTTRHAVYLVKDY